MAMKYGFDGLFTKRCHWIACEVKLDTREQGEQRLYMGGARPQRFNVSNFYFYVDKSILPTSNKPNRELGLTKSIAEWYFWLDDGVPNRRKLESLSPASGGGLPELPRDACGRRTEKSVWIRARYSVAFRLRSFTAKVGCIWRTMSASAVVL